MTNRFDSLITGSTDQSVLLYSAHDATIGGMSHLLGIRDQISVMPAYGSSLNLELHENSKIVNDYEVKLVYFVSYDDENSTEVNIPNCSAPCPYKQFKSTLHPSFIADDYDTVCSK